MPELKDVKGLGPKNVELLKELGYGSIDKLAAEYPETLASATKWGTGKCRLIVEDAKKLTVDSLIPLQTLEEMSTERDSKIQYISTGSNQFDLILGGKGLETDSVYGVAGQLGSSKTQLCFTAAVNCIAAGRKVVYIETEASIIRPERLEQIAKAKGLDIDINANLIVIPAKYLDTPDKLLLAYERVEKSIKNEGHDIGLICVDSFAAPFRSFYTGREQFPDRSKMIFRQVAALQRLASLYNICVILTDQVMSVPVADQMTKNMLIAAYGSEKMPALGDSFLHSITVWVAVTRTGKKNWRATVFDAPHLPRADAEFTVDERGVHDR